MTIKKPALLWATVSFGVIVSIATLIFAAKKAPPPLSTTEGLPEPSVQFEASGNKSDLVFQRPEIVQAHLNFPVPIQGRHDVEAVWRRPDGRAQETKIIPLVFPDGGASRADLWIQFNEGANIISLFRDTESEDRKIFNGQWTLETSIKGRPLARASFTIAGY